MDRNKKDQHKSEYLEYSIDRLEYLTMRMISAPEGFTPEAREALKETLLERELTPETLIKNLQLSHHRDREIQKVKQQKKDASSKKTTRLLGRFLGILSIPSSLIVLGVSLSQIHIGGVIASIVWLGCSVWMTFFYKGD